MALNLSFRQSVERFVEERISDFHGRRAANVGSLTLTRLLEAKNPYLFRAKYLESAPDLVKALLDARLSSGEEGLFGNFMEDLAVFVSHETCGGQKSGITGLDIELDRDGIRYLIAVKSGKAWGNATQHKKLRDNFASAVRVIRQNRSVGQLQPTLGICYGKFRTVNNGVYLHIGGQSFWELISHEPELYMDIIEPLGYKAKNFNDEFIEKRNHALNRMVKEFTEQYCLQDGQIDWPRIVSRVSKNMASQ